MIRPLGCMVLAVGLVSASGKSMLPGDFDKAILDAHNAERRAFGSPSLAWNKALEQDARRWAQQLAASGRFDHAELSDQGENLWQGTAGAYSPKQMVGGWIDEKKDFKHGVFPEVSKTGDWADVGHYTQLVWKKTKRLGCAKASGKGMDVLVCRYSPPGNIEGERI